MVDEAYTHRNTKGNPRSGNCRMVGGRYWASAIFGPSKGRLSERSESNQGGYFKRQRASKVP